MADNKQTENLDPPEPLTPEAEATTRINTLQEQIKALEAEVKTLAGRFKNNNPNLVRSLQAENKILQQRLANLETAHFALLSELLKPRFEEDFKTRFEVLRTSAVEFCRNANINPEIWKNIVS